MADEYPVPGWVGVLQRGPIRVMDDTSPESLANEMAERLEALLQSHNGLEPTAEGWRQLALELALKYDPAFELETPVDRKSIGGRPVGMGGFILRSQMKSEMRKGKNQSEAARVIARQSKGKITAKTAAQALSRNAPAPDFMRRAPYEWRADNAMRAAARKLSQE